MAALTADKRREYQGEGHTFHAEVAASTELFEGAIACFDTAGYVADGADTASFVVAGIVCGYVNNTGSNGDKTVELMTGQLEKIATSALVQADVGKNAVIADDQTATDTAAATNDVSIGRIERFETGFVWVRVGVLSETDA